MFGAMVSLLLVSTASCSGMVGPTELPKVDQFIQDYWSLAQSNLISRGVPQARVLLWPPERFRFIPQEPDEGCGTDAYFDDDLKYCVYGTFLVPNTIYYCTTTTNVIIHEAEHAILYKLGYDCWDEIDNGEAGCPR